MRRHVSPSQIDTFKRCHRKWYFQQPLGMRGETTEAQALGKIIHDVLDIYHQTGDEALAIMNFRKDEGLLTKETATLARNMIYGYFKYHEEQGTDFFGDAQFVEEEFTSFEVGDLGVLLMCRPDIVVKKGRSLLIVEHKTAGNFWTYDECLMHNQGKMNSYIVSGSFDDIDEVTVLFNVLYKKYPKTPKITAKGEVSRAAIITTPELYKEAIASVGGEEHDYVDILMKLREHKFHERLEVSYSRKVTEEMIVKTVKEMNRCLKEIPIGCDIPFICKSCDFHDVCLVGHQDGEQAMYDYIRMMGLSKEVR